MDLARKKLREAESAMEDRRKDLAKVKVDLEKVREKSRLDREAALRKEAVEAEQVKKKEDERGAPDANPSFEEWLAQKYPGWCEKMGGWPQHLKEGMELQLRTEHSYEEEASKQRVLREALAAERQKAIDAQEAARNVRVEDDSDIEMLEVANAEESAQSTYSIICPDQAWSEVESDIKKRLVENEVQKAKKARTVKLATQA